MELSTNVIRVGDAVTAVVKVYHPPDGKLEIPELERGKEIVVRDRRWETLAHSEDRAETQVTYDLTSFRVGEHVVATGTVQCTLSEDEVLESPFPISVITVESTLAGEDMPPRDIKGPVSWPGTVPRWVWGLALVALIALVASILLVRFLSQPRTILQQAPPPPPHEVALRALRALMKKGWIESEDVEPFYVELSGIVRRYIEDRFQLRAPEQTTEEFIREATTSNVLSMDHQQLTRDFLEQSDLVKFARHRPAKDDMKAAYDAAERLVRETIPQVETQVEGRELS
jgi:YD repeat-containing protein